MQSVLLHRGYAQIERGLHQPRQLHAHLLHSLRQCQQHMEQPRRLGAAPCGIRRGLLTGQRYACIRCGIFILEHSVKLSDKLFKLLRLVSGHRDHGITPRADDIIELTAVHIGYPERSEPLHGGIQHASHDDISIGASLIYLRAGVTALQTRYRYSICRISVGCPQRLRLSRHQTVRSHSSGAGYGKYALLLGVEIEQHTSLQIGAVQRECAVHADLLVRGKYSLQSRMRYFIICQYSQRDSHSDTVIASQRGIPRPDILSVSLQIKTLCRHVLGAALCPGAYHIQMPLQYHGSRVLISRSRILPYDDIVGRILPISQSQLPGDIDAQIAYHLSIVTSVRHTAQSLEVREDRLRPQL